MHRMRRMRLSFFAPRDDSRRLEHLDVLRHRLERNREQRGEFVDRRIPLSEPVDDRSSHTGSFSDAKVTARSCRSIIIAVFHLLIE